jgi:hypothetical protein
LDGGDFVFVLLDQPDEYGVDADGVDVVGLGRDDCGGDSSHHNEGIEHVVVRIHREPSLVVVVVDGPTTRKRKTKTTPCPVVMMMMILLRYCRHRHRLAFHCIAQARRGNWIPLD